MNARSNGTHNADVSGTTDYQDTTQSNSNTRYATGAISNQYPDSSIARLLDSQLAHKALKYGVETVSFAVINMFFPKRTSWLARVALPLAVNYVLGKWIEENYDEWIATLAHREKQRRQITQSDLSDATPATA